MATVRSIVAGLDEQSRQVASYLYSGYKAAEIATLTGMYPMQVSRVIKSLRTQLEGALL
jgi:DNA-directed RNA polymerase specialized sigma subunit